MKATALVSELMGYDDHDEEEFGEEAYEELQPWRNETDKVEEDPLWRDDLDSTIQLSSMESTTTNKPFNRKVDIIIYDDYQSLNSTSPPVTNDEIMECTICLDEKKMDVLQCGHKFCKDCLINHINIQIQDRNILKDKYIIQKYDNVVDLKLISIFGVNCPHRNCKFIIEDLDLILTKKKDQMIYGEACLDFMIIKMRMNGDLTRCPLGCGFFIQADCLCVNPPCREIQLKLRRYGTRLELLQRQSQSIFRSSAEKKCCPKCFVEISKNGGCDHMFCVMCKTHFNWSDAPEYGYSLQWFRQQAKQLFRERVSDPNASTNIHPKIFSESPWKQQKFFKTNREVAEANPLIKRKFQGHFQD